MITQLSDRDREREEREKEPSTQMDLNPQPLHHEACTLRHSATSAHIFLIQPIGSLVSTSVITDP